jgi:hypothetical protein
VTAKFILSFDCEGKWGSADALTHAHRRDLTDEKLREAYGSILDLLDEFEIESTFAFTGAFSQSPRHFERLRPELDRLSRLAPDYLGPALADVDATRGDGWHGHALVEAVGAARVLHEIALHGVTHVPWTTMDQSFVEAEMCLFEALEGPVRESRTFIFPRNLIAHSQILRKHDFEGYRLARPERSRLAALMSEFDLSVAPERPKPGNGIVRIPAGFFLNWRHGLRRVVPPQVTELRAERLLDRAVREGGVVHYWLHPENVASAPATLNQLRSIVRNVAAVRSAGHCDVLTQLGYCRWIESQP